MKITSLAEYNAASAADRLAFDTAREAKKQAYRDANADADAEAARRDEASRIRIGKQDAAFAATGNRDIYDLPIPAATAKGTAHDDAVMADYYRRAAVVDALLA
jgi:hypothetical protein